MSTIKEQTFDATVDHLVTKCDRMLGEDFRKKQNRVLRYRHSALCNKYRLKSSKKPRSHSIKEVIANENVDIGVDTRIKTNTICSMIDQIILFMIKKEIFHRSWDY